MTTTLRPCPKCSSTDVHIVPLDGGDRGEPTIYAGECAACDYRLENLASNMSGRRSAARAEWNRLVKDPAKAPPADPRR